jgi:hypothetical protein
VFASYYRQALRVAWASASCFYCKKSKQPWLPIKGAIPPAKGEGEATSPLVNNFPGPLPSGSGAAEATTTSISTWLPVFQQSPRTSPRQTLRQVNTAERHPASRDRLLRLFWLRISCSLSFYHERFAARTEKVLRITLLSGMPGIFMQVAGPGWERPRQRSPCPVPVPARAWQQP